MKIINTDLHTEHVNVYYLAWGANFYENNISLKIQRIHQSRKKIDVCELTK